MPPPFPALFAQLVKSESPDSAASPQFSMGIEYRAQ